MRFDGKSAIVTGGSEGIGYAVAEALVAEGCRVVLTARREALLAEATERLGGSTSYVVGDVAHPDTARLTVEHAVDAHGALDLLVCNAGILIPGFVAHQPAREVDQVIDVNLRGTISFVAAAAPALAKSAQSAVVVLSSSIGRHPTPGVGVYGATKAALHYLVPTWAAELASGGTRVNGVCAGITNTPGLQAGAKQIDGLEDEVIATNLIKRIATPEEIAVPVLALLDEGSSGYVSGSVWDIDGGFRKGSASAA